MSLNLHNMSLVSLPCILLILIGCSKERSPTPTTQPSDQQVSTEGVANFGNLGKQEWGSADQRFVMWYPNYQSNGRQLIVGLTQFPNKTLSPSFVLVIKLLDKTSINVAGSTESGQWTHHFKDSNGKTITVRHQLDDETQTETLTIGNSSFDFAAGRLFVLDLAAYPATGIQLTSEAVSSIPTEEPTRSQWEELIGKLRKSQKLVDKLFAE